ncbi:MAG: sirohydrochlorin nickelochelatase [Methanobrevibacter sp.]|jgi:sirohydrochlorin cobaltochelatase|nr:sirohydrochlorin nickelochelatase [Candidatus Methanoflexus mossambicus]
MVENDSSKTGVLLISHGSRLPYGKEVINTLADMYRKTTDYKVGVGYMEIAQPDIATAIDNLVEGTEINKIIAVPVFLAHGVHTKRDIPTILRLPVEEIDKPEKNSNKEGHNHHNHGHGHSHKHSHSHDIKKVNFDGKIVYTEPLGADSLILEIIKNRVNTAE